MKVEVNRNDEMPKAGDPTYDCLECMGAVNDLHPANLFSFPIPEDMTYEDEPIKFEICLK